MAAQWEYKLINVGPSTSLTAEHKLDELGRDRWELVAFQPTSERAHAGEGTYYLKRPRVEGTDDGR